MSWLTEILVEVDPALHSILRELARCDAPIPEIGMELLDDAGRVSGGLVEVAWPEQRVAVVVDGALEPAERLRLENGGWIVLDPDHAAQDRIALAWEALSVSEAPRPQVHDRVPVVFQQGRLLRPALEGADATRWARLCRALGEDEASLPDHRWALMCGFDEGIELTSEAVEDALALGAVLAWPPIRQPVVSVRSEGNLSARDADRLRLNLDLTHEGRPVERQGAVWSDGDQVYLMPATLRSTLDALAIGPPRTTSSDRMLWWGRQKAVLRQHRVAYDRFLDTTDAVVVERLKVRLDDGPDGSELKVSADGVSEQDLTDLADRFDPRSDRPPTILGKDHTGATRRVHVALDPKARAGLYRVRQLRERKKGAQSRGQPWVDEPQLADAPETLLDPDVFDLAAFGDRVVGFGPVVYRVARSPFSSDGGALVLTPAGEAKPLQWSPLEQIELAERLKAAAAKGQAYVEFRGAWVRVPPPEVSEQLKEQGERRARAKAKLVAEPSVLQPALNLDETAYAPADTGAGVVHAGLGRPPGLRVDCALMPHQEHGVAWLVGHAGLAPGASDHGLLADDMGLGKTLQVLSVFAWARHQHPGQGARCLVVAPLSLLENWVEEAERFYPGVLQKVLVLRPSTRTSLQALQESDLVVCSYDTLRRRQLELGRVQWRVMVLDECHQIRNPTALTTHAVLAMNAEVRLGLSGTPVQNAVEDLWSQFDWLAPGLLGDLSAFRKRYGDEELEHVQELRDTLGPRILRRMKSDVLQDRLPPKTFHRIHLAMSDDQLALYERILEDQRHAQQKGSFGVMHRLFKVCAEPTLLSEDATPGPKLAWLQATLEQIRDKGEKAILFAEWYELQDLLADRVERWFGLPVERVNGQVEAGQRLDIVRRFNAADGFRVLLLGPKAAGVGLNITGANHVVHFSRHWNPALEEQATDRAYRIGQEREVHVYLPVVTHPERPSIEEHLDGLLEQKRELAREILAPRHVYSVKSDLQKMVREGRV